MLVSMPYFDGGVDGNQNEIQDFGLIQLTQHQVHYPTDAVVLEKITQDYVKNAGSILHITLCPVACLDTCDVSKIAKCTLFA